MSERYHVQFRFKYSRGVFIIEHTKFEKYNKPTEDNWEIVGVVEHRPDFHSKWIWTPLLGNKAHRGGTYHPNSYSFDLLSDAFAAAADYRQNE